MFTSILANITTFPLFSLFSSHFLLSSSQLGFESSTSDAERELCFRFEVSVYFGLCTCVCTFCGVILLLYALCESFELQLKYYPLSWWFERGGRGWDQRKYNRDKALKNNDSCMDSRLNWNKNTCKCSLLPSMKTKSCWRQHLVKSPLYVNPNIPSASSQGGGIQPEKKVYLLSVNTGDQRNPSNDSYGLGTVYACKQTQTHRLHTLITMWCKQSDAFWGCQFSQQACACLNILFHVTIRVIFVALPLLRMEILTRSVETFWEDSC